MPDYEEQEPIEDTDQYQPESSYSESDPGTDYSEPVAEVSQPDSDPGTDYSEPEPVAEVSQPPDDDSDATESDLGDFSDSDMDLGQDDGSDDTLLGGPR